MTMPGNFLFLHHLPDKITMPGTIFDIKCFAVHDGPGIRTTVFLKGCPLQCRWCHNPEGQDPEPCCTERKIPFDGREFSEEEVTGRRVTCGEVMAEVLKERLIMEESGGGVTFSGGEPLMQAAFLAELLTACREEGFHTAVDTSGYAVRSDLATVAPLTSLFLYDLKVIDEGIHRRTTGLSNAMILANFRWLADQGYTMRVRIPLIREISATPKNIRETLDFLAPHAGVIDQVDLLPYHRTGVHKYQKLGIRCDMPASEAEPSAHEVEEIATLFREKGFRVKTGG